jgi:hypothetical protein
MTMTVAAAAVAEMPEYPACLWDDLLDAIYDLAGREWERDRTDLADALASLADGLAKEPVVAGLRGEL